MKRKPYRKPNVFSYTVGRIVAFFYNKRLHNRFVRNDLKNVKGPAVVLGNHASSFDQFIATRACHKRLTFVIGDAIYYTRPCPWFFKALHLIHKQQFFTTLSDIRSMKNVIDDKGILMLYPAGVIPCCGKSTKLLSATGKLLKMLRADTYIILEHGLYLSNPKWQKSLRRGKTETEIFRLFSAEEIAKLDPEEIYSRTSEALFFNDYAWQEKRMVEYRGGKSVSGLQNVLHSCPACGSHFSIKLENDKLVCPQCGFYAGANNYGFLESGMEELRDPSVWESLLHGKLKTMISENPGFSYSSRVTVTKLDTKQRRFTTLGDGTFKVNREEISVVLESGESIYRESTRHFPILPMIPGEYFDLQDGKTVFRCFTEERKDAVYITDMITCFAELREAEAVTGPVPPSSEES